MRRTLTAIAVIGMLVMAGAIYAQEGGEGKKGPDRRGPGMKGPGGGMGQVFRGVQAIVPELDAAQKTKFDAAMQKMGEAIKKAQEQFEIDLADILTAEQMEKFKAAKDAPPEQFRRGDRGEKGDRGKRGDRGDRPPKPPRDDEEKKPEEKKAEE